MGAGPVTLLLVDDHPLYHAGLTSVLAVQRPDWTLLGAPDAAAGLEALRSRPDIDLVLIDIVLPGADGFSAVADYGHASPQTPRMLISGKDDAASQLRASRCGASGFVSKAWPFERIMAMIERVLDGGSGFDAEPTPAAAAPGALNLTLRQLEVLGLLVQGCSNKEIGRRLMIADRTVRAHLTDLFQALGVASRMKAVLRAQDLGLAG